MKVRRLFTVLVALFFCLVFVICVAEKNSLTLGPVVSASEDRPIKNTDAETRVSQATTGIQPNYRDSRETAIREEVILVRSPLLQTRSQAKALRIRFVWSRCRNERQRQNSDWRKRLYRRSGYKVISISLLSEALGWLKAWVRWERTTEKERLRKTLSLIFFCGEGDAGLRAALALGRRRCRAYCVSR